LPLFALKLASYDSEPAISTQSIDDIAPRNSPAREIPYIGTMWVASRPKKCIFILTAAIEEHKNTKTAFGFRFQEVDFLMNAPYFWVGLLVP
jgi:hypothetical protein